MSFVVSESITHSETFVSFDMVSLFTRFPTRLAVQVAIQRQEEDDTLDERTALIVNDIHVHVHVVDLLEFCSYVHVHVHDLP